MQAMLGLVTPRLRKVRPSLPVEALALDRTTMHRTLQTLADEGLVEQDARTKRYHLGLDFFALATVASKRYGIHKVVGAAVAKLAEALDDTAPSSTRLRYGLICVEAHAGVFPVRMLATDIAARTPLGARAGATGIAFQAALPNDEVAEVLQHNAARLQKYASHRPERVATAFHRFRKVGVTACTPPWAGLRFADVLTLLRFSLDGWPLIDVVGKLSSVHASIVVIWNTGQQSRV